MTAVNFLLAGMERTIKVTLVVHLLKKTCFFMSATRKWLPWYTVTHDGVELSISISTFDH